MGVQDLINGGSNEEIEEENSSEFLDFVELDESPEVVCSSCRSGEVEKHEYYWRCRNTDCGVTTFIPA